MQLKLGFVALALFAMPGLAAAQRPVADYGSLPAITDVAISPSGNRLVRGIAGGGLSGFVITEVDGGRTLYANRLQPEVTLRGVGWADEDHATYLSSQTVSTNTVLPVYITAQSLIEYFRLGIASVERQRIYLVAPRNAEPYMHGFISSMRAPIEGDPGFGRIQTYLAGDELGRQAVYRVDLNTGEASPTNRGEADTVRFILNSRGEPVARVDANQRTNRWRLLAHVEGPNYREIEAGDSPTGTPPSYPGLLADGRLVAFGEEEEGQQQGLVGINLQTGERETVYDGSADEVIRDPWTAVVVGVGWTDDLPKQHFFDAEMEQVYHRVNAAFSDGYAHILSWSQDRRRVVVYGEHASDAGGYYIFEPAEGRLLLIGLRYPNLTSVADLGERQSITYRARDGTRIPAYLTLPGTGERQNLPLVLLVHGGPHARDTFEFDWWASFLASRGYAVLQPNFRGSTGYGEAWVEAGRRQWGGLMQTDVEDGVAALARSGMIDGGRVCIVGASYGGYAALAGATLTPERYPCAVSIAGVSDLLRMLDQGASRTGARSSYSDFWRRSMGDRVEDRDGLRSVSPVNLAANVRVPILLMHGEEDTVVPIQQSRVMEEALRRAGKNFRFVTLRGDDHWLSAAETRTQMLGELEAFLAENIGRPANAP